MSAPARPLTVEKRKWSGPPSARWEARLLDAESGRLCWRTEAGTPRLRPALGEIEPTRCTELSFACSEWWVATAYVDDDGAIDRWKIDAATPAVHAAPARVHFTDLDLDIVVDGAAPGGRLLDREVFEHRAVALGYPLGVRRGAEEGIAAARRRIERSVWPFDGSLDALLEAARAGHSN